MSDVSTDISTLVGFGLFCLIVGVGLYFLFGRGETVVFNDEREEQLTKQLADRLGCSWGIALGFVRREIELAPKESDQTILKRAEYHYRRNLPESGLCGTYRNRTRG
jgi:hypothetical protein